jgi:hypothetical protein
VTRASSAAWSAPLRGIWCLCHWAPNVLHISWRYRQHEWKEEFPAITFEAMQVKYMLEVIPWQRRGTTCSKKMRKVGWAGAIDWNLSFWSPTCSGHNKVTLPHFCLEKQHNIHYLRSWRSYKPLQSDIPWPKRFQCTGQWKGIDAKMLDSRSSKKAMV